MEWYQESLIQSAALLIIYFITKRITFQLINKTMFNQQLLKTRGAILKRVLNVVLMSLSLVFILLIWGVDKSELALFVGSTLTIVGVAFFAQWSLLSNITASAILFFNHPVRINDYISILEGKEYVIEGTITGIGLFFITLETEKGEELTLPNNVFIQKSILKKNNQDNRPVEPSDVNG